MNSAQKDQLERLRCAVSDFATELADVRKMANSDIIIGKCDCCNSLGVGIYAKYPHIVIGNLHHVPKCARCGREYKISMVVVDRRKTTRKP
mgnify:CR=1 FL=1